MITVIDLGLTEYEDSYRIQKALVARRKSDEVGDALILAEHKNIFTIGRIGRRENLLVGDDILKADRINVLDIDRGGDITFHGPGQLVLYPVIDLGLRQKDLHKYLRDLEEVVIRFLKRYSVSGRRIEGKTGVWVGAKKIASIGIASSRWVTYHGASINLNNDLRFFSMINPCGIKGAQVTSLKAILNKEIDMEEAKRLILSEFKNIFGLPAWLKRRLVVNEEFFNTRKVLADLKINTVCESGLCPNMNECFSHKTATFLILGKQCTRACAFCSVEKAGTLPVDPSEPRRIAAAAQILGLKYVVVTSVTRDDISDGGGGQFAATIRALKGLPYKIKIEVLVPDFRQAPSVITKILEEGPDIFGHNIETVKRLYPAIRTGADYKRSLALLRSAGQYRARRLIKSGIMLGLGETEKEVLDTIRDIRATGCDMLTIGQYLRPSPRHAAVERFASPEEFDYYKEAGERMGFKYVASAPLVRSSYLAEEGYIKTKIQETKNERCYTAAVG